MRSHLLLAAASLAIALPASANELPKRKPGLWSISVALQGKEIPMRSIQQCTDESTDSLMQSNLTGAMGRACSQTKIERDGDTITIDSACKFGATNTTSHTVIKGDFNSAYTMTTTSRHTGGPSLPHTGGRQETQVSMQAKWLGPCAKDQKPGDIVMPGGIRINVRNLKIPNL